MLEGNAKGRSYDFECDQTSFFNAHQPSPQGRKMSDELSERIKKLEDQMGWIIDRHFDTGNNPKIEKLEIQVNCLRKQILDLEGKKSYTEQAREYADMRSKEDG